jgi:hypothetical protein
MERITRYILIVLCAILLLDRFLPAGCSSRADRAILKRLDEGREKTEQSISTLEQANEKLHDMEQAMKQYLAYVEAPAVAPSPHLWPIPQGSDDSQGLHGNPLVQGDPRRYCAYQL